MTNILSKLYFAVETWSFKYNCYEAVHPWNPYCSYSALDIGITVFGEAFKLYTPLYLFSQLMQRKLDYDSFKHTSQSILRSTTFISANAFFGLFFFCSSQYFTRGKFYYYAVAYIPGFIASAMAVMIEKPNRRSSLAFYVANVASEVLFRIYVARGYIRPINHGQVYIFTIAIATIMFLAKKHGFEDDPLSSIIKLIVGPEEASGRRRKHNIELDTTKQKMLLLENIQQSEPISSRPIDQQVIENSSFGKSIQSSSDDSTRPIGILDRILRVYRWIKLLLQRRHILCPHKDSSCLYYSIKASIRAFIIGYSVQLGLKLFTKAPIIFKGVNGGLTRFETVKNIVTDTGLLRIGLFLSTFSGFYKATNCCLRWTLNSSSNINCFVAGLVAGPALFIYPSPTVALYVLWKCLEALFHEAVRKKFIKNKDLFIVIIYSLATSQLFYSALMDPQYMKKSYLAFLDKISRRKLHMINRSVLDVFGTEASSGYEDYFPDLHPKFMSHAFLGSIWIWMIEQKVVGKQLET